jgi:hypothetical protein
LIADVGPRIAFGARLPEVTRMEANKLKAVYSIVQRPGTKPYWMRVGVGFVNQDGSISVKLDAFPQSWRLEIKDLERAAAPAAIEAAKPAEVALS